MQTNHDQYKTGEHDSTSPMNCEQLPAEPTLVEQLQFEVDELNGKLRNEIEIKQMYWDRCKAYEAKQSEIKRVVEYLEAIEQLPSFKVSGVNMDTQINYLKQRERLYNLLND